MKITFKIEIYTFRSTKQLNPHGFDRRISDFLFSFSIFLNQLQKKKKNNSLKKTALKLNRTDVNILFSVIYTYKLSAGILGFLMIITIIAPVVFP